MGFAVLADDRVGDLVFAMMNRTASAQATHQHAAEWRHELMVTEHLVEALAGAEALAWTDDEGEALATHARILRDLRAALHDDQWEAVNQALQFAAIHPERRGRLVSISATGKTTPKVFKWTTIDLAAGETMTLTKTRLIQTASTRRYHAGIHRVELQIAGSIAAEGGFDLLDSSG